MEEYQNGTNGQGAPQTYGEESQMRAQGNMPNQQPNEQYGQSNPQMNGQYGQSNPQMNGQYGQSNPNPYPYAYGPGGPGMAPARINNVFCYILLAVMPLHKIITMLTNYITFKSMDLNSIMAGDVSSTVSPVISVLSILNYVFWILYIVFIILDIVQINKGGYKITGLVLFAIFLKQGYYAWRAHVMGEKMTVPVVYTVFFAILTVINYAYAFYLSFGMVSDMMNMM